METEVDIQLVSVQEIPLTAEFLERQNFNHNDIVWWFSSSAEAPLVVVSGNGCHISGLLKTASQLQMALDLCGIKHKMIYK